MEEIKCVKCGNKMVERKSKTGSFLGCSKYPVCRNTITIKGEVNTKLFVASPTQRTYGNNQGTKHQDSVFVPGIASKDVNSYIKGIEADGREVFATQELRAVDDNGKALKEKVDLRIWIRWWE